VNNYQSRQQRRLCWTVKQLPTSAVVTNVTTADVGPCLTKQHPPLYGPISAVVTNVTTADVGAHSTANIRRCHKNIRRCHICDNGGYWTLFIGRCLTIQHPGFPGFVEIIRNHTNMFIGRCLTIQHPGFPGFVEIIRNHTNSGYLLVYLSVFEFFLQDILTCPNKCSS